MNQQPIEKQNLDAEGFVDVHSTFLTTQGEGPFTGQRAVFVRLAGCNLQCPGCDTDYTSTRVKYAPLDLSLKVREISRETKMLVVFTGGEPLRQNIVPVIERLLEHGYTIQVETNGTLFLDLPSEVVVVCSPKTSNLNLRLAGRIAALKYVVKAGDVRKEDGLPIHALDHAVGSRGVARPNQCNDHTHIYVQPMDEKDEVSNLANLHVAIDSVMDHGYSLCLQIHKIIGVE